MLGGVDLFKVRGADKLLQHSDVCCIESKALWEAFQQAFIIGPRQFQRLLTPSLH